MGAVGVYSGQRHVRQGIGRELSADVKAFVLEVDDSHMQFMLMQWHMYNCNSQRKYYLNYELKETETTRV